MKHPICMNKASSYHYERMHRLYTRDKNKQIPIGWICHSCKKIIQDWEIIEFLEKNENFDSWRIEINDIRFYNPEIYLKS